MADQAAINTILKTLARATSDNAAEADVSIKFAHTRMQKEGVTFEDLLKQPDDKLYQASLMRLAEHIARVAPDLSEDAKRRLYNAHVQKVVERFASPGSGGRGGEGGSTGQTDRDRERETYERSRREEEARRARSEPPPRQEQGRRDPPPRPPGREENPYSRQNVKTASSGGWQYEPERFPLEFSIRNFFLFFFGPNSYIGSIYSYPKHALGLLFQSCLVGGLTFGAILVTLVILVKSTDLYPALLIGRVFFYNIWLTLAAIVFVTSYIFYERGWYPRGPRAGETDFVSMTTSTWRLVLALLLRVYGAALWVGRQAYTLGQKLAATSTRK